MRRPVGAPTGWGNGLITGVTAGDGAGDSTGGGVKWSPPEARGGVLAELAMLPTDMDPRAVIIDEAGEEERASNPQGLGAKTGGGAVLPLRIDVKDETERVVLLLAVRSPRLGRLFWARASFSRRIALP